MVDASTPGAPPDHLSAESGACSRQQAMRPSGSSRVPSSRPYGLEASGYSDVVSGCSGRGRSVCRRRRARTLAGHLDRRPDRIGRRCQVDAGIRRSVAAFPRTNEEAIARRPRALQQAGGTARGRASRRRAAGYMTREVRHTSRPCGWVRIGAYRMRRIVRGPTWRCFAGVIGWLLPHATSGPPVGVRRARAPVRRQVADVLLPLGRRKVAPGELTRRVDPVEVGVEVEHDDALAELGDGLQPVHP